MGRVTNFSECSYHVSGCDFRLSLFKYILLNLRLSLIKSYCHVTVSLSCISMSERVFLCALDYYNLKMCSRA